VSGDLVGELLRKPAELVTAEVFRAAGDVGEREHVRGVVGAGAFLEACTDNGNPSRTLDVEILV